MSLFFMLSPSKSLSLTLGFMATDCRNGQVKTKIGTLVHCEDGQIEKNIISNLWITCCIGVRPIGKVVIRYSAEIFSVSHRLSTTRPVPTSTSFQKEAKVCVERPSIADYARAMFDTQAQNSLSRNRHFFARSTRSARPTRNHHLHALCI